MRLIRQVRLAAVVMSLTMVLWIAGQYIGGQLGLDPRYRLPSRPCGDCCTGLVARGDVLGMESAPPVLTGGNMEALVGPGR
jgi:hypothetical protein